MLYFSYSEIFQIFFLNSLAIAFSALVSAKIAEKKYNQIRFLVLWIVIGILSSIFPLLIGFTSYMQVIIVAVIWGLSWGFGMPTCMAYYADNTRVINRGRIGGAVFCYLFRDIFTKFFTFYELKIQFLILTIWRTWGLIFFFIKRSETDQEVKKSPSYRTLLVINIFSCIFLHGLCSVQ